MSSPDEQTPSDLPAETQPAFERSLDELSRIVERLEDGSLGLDDSLREFERGVTLLRSCYETLDRAEQTIALLTGFDAEGNALTAPFDASATLEQNDQTAGRRRTRRRQPTSEPEQPGGETENGQRLF